MEDFRERYPRLVENTGTQLDGSQRLDATSASSQSKIRTRTQKDKSKAVQSLLPLNSVTKEIRLVNILPKSLLESDDSPISLAVRVVSLDKNPEYIAVSYEWGPELEEPPTSVFINGEQVRLRANLVKCLLYLRKHPAYWCEELCNRTLSGRPLFWIDAISINQDDVEEREAQVQIMGEIFSKAIMVKAWLGPARDNSDLVMTYLEEKHLGNTFEELAYSVKQDWMNVEKKELFIAFAAFLKRPYWTRGWIIQELTRSDELTFICGSHEVAFGAFSIICTALCHSCRIRRGEISYHMLEAYTAVIERSLLVELILRARGKAVHEAFHMYRLLEEFKNMRTTLPQDRIYALAGIADPFPHEYPEVGIKIDYKSPAEVVFTRTAIAIIRGMKSFQLFEYSVGHSSQTLSLPSWVPDWSAHEAIRAEFRAQVLPPSEEYRGVTFEENNTVLRTFGHVIGDISDIEEHHHEFKTTVDPQSFSNWMSFFHQDVADYFPPTDESSSQRMYECAARWIYALVFNVIRTPEALGLDWSEETWVQWFKTERNKMSLPSHPAIFGFMTLALAYRVPFRCRKRESVGPTPQKRPPHFGAASGTCSLKARAGDVIAAVPGAPFLLVLRPSGKEQHYTLVGAAHILAYENGEAVTEFPEEEINLH